MKLRSDERMSDIKLKPCPFCGGKLRYNTILTIFICDECKVHIGFDRDIILKNNENIL